MLRIICDLRPREVFVENVPMLTSRGLHIVLGDLAEAGYDCKWMCLSAAQVGANHKRERIWILGNTHNNGQAATKKQRSTNKRGNPGQTRAIKTGKPSRSSKQYEELANADSPQFKRAEQPQRGQEKHADPGEHCGWEVEPELGRVAYGVANGVDRLKAIGNGQVPQCAAEAYRILSGD